MIADRTFNFTDLLGVIYPDLSKERTITLWAKRASNKTLWRTLPNDTPEALSDEALQLSSEGWDVYFSVCPIKPEASYIGEKNKRIAAADVAEIPVLFMDIDTLADPVKRSKGAVLADGVEDALNGLMGLPLPPSYCVSSGHGVHAYWGLSEPLEAEPNNVILLKQFESAVKLHTGWLGLDSASEPARVLRVPGTCNYKEKGVPLPVKGIECNANRYTAKEVSEWVNSELFKDATLDDVMLYQQSEQGFEPDSYRREDSEIIRLARAQKHSGQEFSELYDNGTSGDNSAADYKLCRLLAYWTFHPDQIDSIFRGSALYRDKWESRPDYREMTINKAIDQVKSRTQAKSQRLKGAFPLVTADVNNSGSKGGDDDDREYLTYELFKGELRAAQIEIRYNIMSHSIEFKGMPRGFSHENLPNTAPPYIREELLRAKYKGTTENRVSDFITWHADLHRYSPVTDWLEGLNYIPEFDAIKWLCDEVLQLDEHDGLSRELVKLWLVQCVAMAYNTSDHGKRPYGAAGVLTLQGVQELGKTTFFRELVPYHDWFREGVQIDMSKTDDQMKATDAWIVELGEVDQTLKKEQSSLKSFITNTEDIIRVPYAKAHTKNPRRTSLCATVNEEKFLRDPTGSRRWWTVPVTNVIRWQLLREKGAKEAVWAQAYDIWLREQNNSNQGFRPSSAANECLAKRNGDFDSPMTGEDEFMRRMPLNWDLEGCKTNLMTLSDIIDSIGMRGNVTPAQMGRVLAKLSRENENIKQVRTSGQRLWQVPEMDMPRK